MMGLGSNDVSTQVFPLVQFTRNLNAMRGNTAQPILEGLASVFYSSNRALIALCFQISAEQKQSTHAVMQWCLR